MSLLDAFGRPITKQEVEEMSSRVRSIMMPATQLFGQFAQVPSDDYGAFAIADGDGHMTDPGSEERASYAAPLTSSPYANTNDRWAHANPLSRINQPLDTRGIMTQSMKYAQSNYIVSRSIRIKRNFALREMQFVGATATSRDFFQDEFARLQMRRILSQVFRHHWITGRSVVFWGDERPVRTVTTLDPRYIVVRRVLGSEIVFLHPDPRWQRILMRESEGASYKLQAQLLRRKLPKYWMPYIKAGEMIPLKEESYALIENDLESFNLRGTDAPGNTPLQPIFNDLDIMETLVAGDFEIAWMMKNMVVLVSIGDPEKEGDRYVRPDQAELQKLRTALQRPDKAMIAYVDPTVDWRWITPDPALFDQAKYKQRVEAIEYCMGVPRVFSSGNGDFASGSLSMKPFREEIETGRIDIMSQLCPKFFAALREGRTKRMTGTKDPQMSFDTDCLKDDRVLQDELQGKYDRGAVSVRSLLEGKAQDFETELSRKTEEKPYAETFRPLWDMNHGIDAGDGGRPATGNRPQSESGNGQTPRPSRPT